MTVMREESDGTDRMLPEAESKACSFSVTVKTELSAKSGADEGAMLSELAGLLLGGAVVSEFPCRILLAQEREEVISKAVWLINRLTRSEERIERWDSRKKVLYRLRLEGPAAEALLTKCGLWRHRHYERHVPFELLRRQSDEQAFLRGFFLVSGRMSDPRKLYQCELEDADAELIEEIAQILLHFGLESHYLEKKRGRSVRHILYLQDGEQIVDLLNVIQAYTALMELENIRIEKEMRNQINRTVNCEAANLHKVVQAAMKQTEDIEYVVQCLGWEGMPDGLAEMARIRLEHPEESLSELGQHMQPPIGRSGIHHRLRRLTELAETLRSRGGISEE